MTSVWEDELKRDGAFAGSYKLNLPGGEGHDPAMPLAYRLDADGNYAATLDVYVDDTFGIAPTREAALRALREVVQKAGAYGFVLKYSKLKGPRRHGRTFHGFSVDTRPEHGGPKIEMRPEVRSETRTLVDLALSSSATINRRALAKLVGKLLSVAPAVPHGVTFLRRLWDSLHCLDRPAWSRPRHDEYDVDVALDSEHRKDLRWWATALRKSDGTYLLRNRDVRTRAHYTDGSGYGTGGCSYELSADKLPKLEFFSGLWRGEATSMTSNWKELRSILLALRRERQQASGAARPPLRSVAYSHLPLPTTS